MGAESAAARNAVIVGEDQILGQDRCRAGRNTAFNVPDVQTANRLAQQPQSVAFGIARQRLEVRVAVQNGFERVGRLFELDIGVAVLIVIENRIALRSG